jgi:hypothetical protein
MVGSYRTSPAPKVSARTAAEARGAAALQGGFPGERSLIVLRGDADADVVGDERLDADVFDATREHHAAVVRILARFRGTKLSYTDGSSLVHLEKRKIKRVWSTDHHLGVSGAEVLPRS